MDTRLTELLPKALNLKNGDAKIIKNAGASIMHPFGSTTRSIVVAVYQFDVEEIVVIGHYDCGMSNLDAFKITGKMKERGISPDSITMLCNAGIDINKWLEGFNSIEESIEKSVAAIKNHPLIAKDVIVHGLIMEPQTGRLHVIVNGYQNC
jgi:carbonic anhydrase